MPYLPEPAAAVAVEQGAADLWRSAPALLQQMRRRHTERTGRRARRVLFGPVDRDEMRRFVKEELAAIRAADQEKYNFDFENILPMAGPYEWKKVSPSEASPAYGLARLQNGLHRSARRLEFGAPRCAATEPDTEAQWRPATTEPEPEAQRRPASTEPEPEAQRRPAATEPEPDAQRRSAADAPPQSLPTPVHQDATASPSAAAAASAPPPPPLSGQRQTTITDFWRSRKRPSAFTVFGDHPATKRAGSASSAPSAASAASPASPTPNASA